MYVKRLASLKAKSRSVAEVQIIKNEMNFFRLVFRNAASDDERLPSPLKLRGDFECVSLAGLDWHVI